MRAGGSVYRASSGGRSTNTAAGASSGFAPASSGDCSGDLGESAPPPSSDDPGSDRPDPNPLASASSSILRRALRAASLAASLAFSRSVAGETGSGSSGDASTANSPVDSSNRSVPGAEDPSSHVSAPPPPPPPPSSEPAVDSRRRLPPPPSALLPPLALPALPPLVEVSAALPPLAPPAADEAWCSASFLPRLRAARVNSRPAGCGSADDY